MASNFQLDSYTRLVSDVQMIPSQSYEGVFTNTGKWKPRILSHLGLVGHFDPRKPWFVILNMDRWTSPGNHWVLLAYLQSCPQGQHVLFYYDPLLPNKCYEMPTPLRLFVEHAQESGCKLVTNWDADQEKTTMSNGIRVTDIMCGAYCVAMLEALVGSKNKIDTFYEYPMPAATVQRIFRTLMRS